eukprot:4520248-Amphidinium_carterae.1
MIKVLGSLGCRPVPTFACVYHYAPATFQEYSRRVSAHLVWQFWTDKQLMDTNQEARPFKATKLLAAAYGPGSRADGHGDCARQGYHHNTSICVRRMCSDRWTVGREERSDVRRMDKAVLGRTTTAGQAHPTAYKS